MPTLHSHTHCQVAQADTQAKTWQRVCLSNRTKDSETHDRQEGHLLTAPTRNWRFSASYDSFLVQQTLVLRMNICGKNRQLLVAANRYRKPYDDSANIKQTDMKRAILDYITERQTARPASQRNEVLFFAYAHFLFFNFIATAQNTLSFFSPPHPPPKKI
ncbi:MAG: hypothetical protein IPH24_14755 [Crocinitomicaceae bacterium]|nr:hypothetical protein [Crocinitomicaceae bacterium]